MDHEGTRPTLSLQTITEYGNAQVVAVSITDVINWEVSLLRRIDVLARRGLSPIKTKILEAIAAEEKFLAIQRFGIGANILALSAAFRSDLLAGDRHLDFHPAAEFLPEVPPARSTSNLLVEADKEHWSMVYDLAQFYLSADEVGSMLLNTARQSAVEKCKDPGAKNQIGIWEIVYSCIRGEESYEFNQPTRELYDQVVQYPHLCKRPCAILLATLFCYYMGILYGRSWEGEDPARVDIVLRHARESTTWFWNAIVEEEFPNHHFGNIFNMPVSLRG